MATRTVNRIIPNDGHEHGPIDELNLNPDQNESSTDDKSKERPPMQIVWKNVVRMLMLHAFAVYGIVLLPTASRWTLLWSVVLYMITCLGITAGAHRLWTHRSYKAKLPLRILLAIFNSAAFQNDIIEWSRDHRVHHKYSETDADPHNAKRGFFFSHIGWLMVRKHPDVKEKGKKLDISDLLADPVLQFQRKYYYQSVIIFCWLIPTVVPNILWDESLVTAFFISGVVRYVIVLHFTWCVNSLAHMYGSRPYDKYINPAENPVVAFVAGGEGFHNYHHTFPHDYSTAELGWFLNISKLFIDLCALLGQVYDRKEIPKEVIQRRKERTG